jgi:hypothetical protein
MAIVVASVVIAKRRATGIAPSEPDEPGDASESDGDPAPVAASSQDEEPTKTATA